MWTSLEEIKWPLGKFEFACRGIGIFTHLSWHWLPNFYIIESWALTMYSCYELLWLEETLLFYLQFVNIVKDFGAILVVFSWHFEVIYLHTTIVIIVFLMLLNSISF